MEKKPHQTKDLRSSGLSPEELQAIANDEDSWRRWYSGLSASERKKLESGLKGSPRVGPQAGPQTMAFNSKADVIGFGGSAGGGKGERPEALIVSPKKLIELGKLEAGDKICDAFGGVQRVLSVRIWGDWSFRRVHFSDGTSIACSPEHLWLAWRSPVGVSKRTSPNANAAGLVHGMEAARLMETDQLLRDMERGRSYRIRLSKPAVGNYNRYKIDPYSLGAILGDGHMPKHKGVVVSVHIEDIEILRHMQLGLSDFKIRGTTASRPSVVNGYLSIKSEDHARLRDLGLNGKRSWEKFIPPQAIHAPIEWRWSLLQGLLDTDGWVEEGRCAYYCTTSEKLRDGVAQLARSLGCFVTITSKFPNYPYKGEILEGRPAWALRIKSATPEKLFRIARKREIASRLVHQSLSKEITDIEDIGRDHCLCIQVDHPSGLYLTNDYTVTHNSALIAILALLEHRRSVIFRKDGKQLRGLIDDLVQFVGSDNGLNRSSSTFYLQGGRNVEEGRMIEWGGIGEPGSELTWKGRAHDGLFVDEATEISEDKVRFLMTWLRTPIKGQRCRCVMTFNPPGGPGDPSGGQGRWVVKYFAPWLDERHPNPARSGEIRWFATNSEGEEIEVDSSEPFEVTISGERVMMEPQSRTFIASRVYDNKYLADTNYERNLKNLKEPFRSMMLLGDFRSGAIDHDYQVIPTRWLDAAIDRWEHIRDRNELNKYRTERMCSMGVDVARGGRDNTILSRRHGWFWDELIIEPGKSTPDGVDVMSLCARYVRDAAIICIDVIGPGASPYDFLNKARIPAKAIKGNASKGLYRIDAELGMYNLRALLYWTLRKVLDPANGLDPMLPPDDRLRSSLLSIIYERMGDLIKLETKDKTKLRLGFSPDEADAVAYSLYELGEEPGLRNILVDWHPVNKVRKFASRFRGRGTWMSI